MKSLPTPRRDSEGLTKALAAKYRGLLTGGPQTLVLWLPLHRTPSPNRLGGRLRLTIQSKAEAKEALLAADVRGLLSSSTGSGC